MALALGHHKALVPDLERAVAAEPLDEHLLLQLMTALYRSGRQADALARYREGRQRLVRELGIEPGAELRSLEQAILQQHSGLTAPPREAKPEPARAAAGSKAAADRLGSGDRGDQPQPHRGSLGRTGRRAANLSDSAPATSRIRSLLPLHPQPEYHRQLAGP